MYVYIYMRGIVPVPPQIKRKAEQMMITELKDKQIEIIALMNSWVFSRLIAENESAGDSLAREMDAVAEAEREQGMSPSSTLITFLSPWAGPARGLFFQSLYTNYFIFLQASRLHTHGFRHLI